MNITILNRCAPCKRKAFTLIELMIVIAIIGILTAVAVPNFLRARRVSQTNACLANLRQIDGAIQMWALEKGKTANDTVTSLDVVEYLGRGTGQFPKCPAGGVYLLTDVATKPTCDKTDHVLP